MRLQVFLWLKLVLIIMVLGGQWSHIFPNTLYINSSKELHPFLCAKKMPLKDMTLADLLATDVLSLNKSLKIYNFLQKNPHASLKDLTILSGIGDKTIAKLADFVE